MPAGGSRVNWEKKKVFYWSSYLSYYNYKLKLDSEQMLGNSFTTEADKWKNIRPSAVLRVIKEKGTAFIINKAIGTDEHLWLSCTTATPPHCPPHRPVWQHWQQHRTFDYVYYPCFWSFRQSHWCMYSKLRGEMLHKRRKSQEICWLTVNKEQAGKGESRGKTVCAHT